LRTLVVVRRDTAALLVVGSLGILITAVVTGRDVKLVGPIVVLIAIIAAAYRSLFRWHSLVGLILAVILFVPIGRYKLPGSLPFNLELYRVVVALVVAVWLASLLVDSRVRWRSTPFDRPVLFLLACILLSEITNPGRVNLYGSYVIKTLTFFLSFVLVYFVVATQVQRRESIDFLLRFLTVGGAVIGALGIVERRTHFNVFNHLHAVLPLLRYEPQIGTSAEDLTRAGNFRVLGPAEHPIALGAMLVMIVPISIYLTRTQGRRWLIAAVLLLLGALATGSRTAVSMILAEFVLFLIVKPRETKRLLPLFVPAIVVIHVLTPGALAGFRSALFPKGGLIAEQSQLAVNANPQLAGGRIRQIKPMVKEASHHPFFGEGLGTRITGFNVNQRNAPILDDQWLDILLDVGFIGFGLWIWLFVRSVRMLLRRARESSGDGDEWLFLGLAASILSFAIGMLTFDAFSFTQVYFVFWIVLGLASALLSDSVSGQELARLRPASWTSAI
jgi:polysaccharide biosynthesis protein PslJ